MGRKKDLTGKTFGELKVIKFCKVKNGTAYWACKCSCGNVVITKASSLTTGYKKSCGHEKYRIKGFEMIGDTQEKFKNGEKKYVFKNLKDGTFFTSSINRVKSGQSTGYVSSDQNKIDARRASIVSEKIRSAAKARGISFSKNGKKFIARIMVKRKNLYLGSFSTKEEAIEARKEAEKIYFKN